MDEEGVKKYPTEGKHLFEINPRIIWPKRNAN